VAGLLNGGCSRARPRPNHRLVSCPPGSGCRSPLAGEFLRLFGARRVRAVGVRLRTNLLRLFGARRVRSQASSYRGQRNGFVHALFARCRSPLADEPVAIVRCPPRSLASELLPGATEWFGARRVRVVGVRLRTNLLRSFGARRVRSQASSYRGQRDGLVHAAFARKRAPTGGNGMVWCTPCSLASELLPGATGWFGARRVRPQAGSYRGMRSAAGAFRQRRPNHESRITNHESRITNH
jgi:hypothetical protein